MKKYNRIQIEIVSFNTQDVMQVSIIGGFYFDNELPVVPLGGKKGN